MNMTRLCTALTTTLLLCAAPLSARELEEGEWYLRLILSAAVEGLEDRGNTLGQLRDAEPEFDRYDLHELGQPFAGDYLSVVFHRPDWAVTLETQVSSWATGAPATDVNVIEMDWIDFNTDYHPVSFIDPIPGCGIQAGEEPGDDWTFEVRSNDTGRQLSLTWEGSADAALERMVLVDLQENITIPAVIDGVVQAYTFGMNGAVRTFAWRLLSDEDYATLNSGRSRAAPAALRSSAAPAALGTSHTRADIPSTQGSGWLPMGWSPHRAGFDQAVPDGLPDNPLAH
ncbi:MAG: hypothetical protein HRT77_06300 [Halioglobus sp.]|nr:hypothetical protein [Halioglobus sp.]